MAGMSPDRDAAQRSVPGHCLEDLNPRMRNMLLHKPSLQLFKVHRAVLEIGTEVLDEIFWFHITLMHTYTPQNYLFYFSKQN